MTDDPSDDEVPENAGELQARKQRTRHTIIGMLAGVLRRNAERERETRDEEVPDEE